MKLHVLGLLLLLLPIASTAYGQADKAPKVSQYSAKVEKALVKSINFKKNPEARTFRTRLSEALKGGVNFAGHYIVASWGCGTGCINSGIIDARNGNVYWPRELGSVVDWVVETTYVNEPLDYRKNSRLLMLHGTPGNDTRAGKYYYELKDNRLRLVKFVKLESN